MGSLVMGLGCVLASYQRVFYISAPSIGASEPSKQTQSSEAPNTVGPSDFVRR